MKIGKPRVKRLALVLALFLAVAAAFIAAFSPCSHVDYTDRARVTEILVSLAPVKNEIAVHLQNDSTVRFDPALARQIPEKTASLTLEYRAVAPDGTITVFNRQLGALLMIRPRAAPDGSIEWSCHGAATKTETLTPACRKPFPVPP
jgi:hypothetical protein